MSRGAYSILASIAVVAALGTAGCSARKPVERVAKAELAVQHASESHASVYSPVELQLAMDKLSAARRAMDDDDNAEARRLADEALVHAQLAEAKAESESARLAADRMRRDIEALQADVTKTVVIEKKTPSTVVVERSTAPDLVIQQQPSPDVVIQRKSATTAVVVEPDPDVIIESR